MIALHPGSISLLAQTRHFLLQMLHLPGLLLLLLPHACTWLRQNAVCVICLCTGSAAPEREGLPSEHVSPEVGQLYLHPPVRLSMAVVAPAGFSRMWSLLQHAQQTHKHNPPFHTGQPNKPLLSLTKCDVGADCNDWCSGGLIAESHRKGCCALVVWFVTGSGVSARRSTCHVSKANAEDA